VVVTRLLAQCRQVLCFHVKEHRIRPLDSYYATLNAIQPLSPYRTIYFIGLAQSITLFALILKWPLVTTTKQSSHSISSFLKSSAKLNSNLLNRYPNT
jgi:hypothetical protein